MEAIFGRTNQQLSTWKNEMRQYEKSKRTKKPFGKSLPSVNRVTHQVIKGQQGKFHPILQTYKSIEDQHFRIQKDQMGRVKSLMNHFKNVKKYQKPYDIVNLYGAEDFKMSQPNKKLGPVRNMYNLINNQKLQQFYYKNRQIQLPVQRQKKLLGNYNRDFNIVTGDFKQNNEERRQQQLNQKDKQTMAKYWKTHNFDPVFGKFYDHQKQQQYQQNLIKQMNEHGKSFDERLPPSYKERQTVILDFSKPLPENLKVLDQKRQRAQKKYQVKYAVEAQYGKRNEQYDDKQEHIVKNRVHNGRVMSQKQKHFDIINMKSYQPTRAQELYGKKAVNTTWDKLISTQRIKSSGFQA